MCRDAPQVSIGRRKRLVQPVSMTNANTLERWRPHPLIYFNCSLAIVLLGGACSWGIALLIARCCQPESAVKTAIAGVGLFVVVLWLSLRRCSTPALPAFRGLLLITSYMNPGSSIRNCCYHCDCSRESLAERYRLRPKAVRAPCGVLSEASDVPVKPWLWPRQSDRCCEIAISLNDWRPTRAKRMFLELPPISKTM